MIWDDFLYEGNNRIIWFDLFVYIEDFGQTMVYNNRDVSYVVLYLYSYWYIVYYT